MSENESSGQESDGESCPTCGDEFDTEIGVKQHHVKAHDESLVQVEVDCAYCGTTLERRRARVESTDRMFCAGEDADCRAKWQSENRTGEDHPSYSRVDTNCANCGDPTTVKLVHFEQYENNYCDKDCLQDDLQNLDLGGNRVDRIIHECVWCGDPVPKLPGYPDVERHFCDDECYNEWQREEGPKGKDHWNWEHGREFYHTIKALLPGISFEQSRRSLKENWDGTCEMCDGDDPKKIDWHHIIPLVSGGVNHPDLLIPLCPKHHAHTEWYTRKNIPECKPLLSDWVEDGPSEGTEDTQVSLDVF